MKFLIKTSILAVVLLVFFGILFSTAEKKDIIEEPAVIKDREENASDKFLNFKKSIFEEMEKHWNIKKSL